MADLIVPSRRGFLTGLGAALITAPAIVRAASLMPIRGEALFTLDDYVARIVEPRWEAYTSVFRWEVRAVVDDFRIYSRIVNIDDLRAIRDGISEAISALEKAGN